MKVVERAVLGMLLAATLATMLLVARNNLAPVQHPLSFGLVLWAWVALFYSAVALAALLLGGLASRLPGLRSLPGRLVFAGAVLFAVVALASNPRAVSSLFSLEGPGLFRTLVPLSAVLCVLALVGVGAPLARGRAGVRIVALVAVASALLALLPDGESPGRSGRASASVRIAGPRFVLVGVDGADWDLLEPLMARGELPHFSGLKERGAWGPLETLRPDAVSRHLDERGDRQAPSPARRGGFRHSAAARRRGDPARPSPLEPNGVFPSCSPGWKPPARCSRRRSPASPDACRRSGTSRPRGARP